MKTLLILSDIHGNFLSGLLTTERVPFDSVAHLNSLELAGIPEQPDPDVIHRKFIEEGIEVAARAVIGKYRSGIDTAIGLSIGGWRAALLGLPVQKLICFSSTRLRFETTAPGCKTQLYFGELDEYCPANEWFTRLQQEQNIIRGAYHDFYRAQLALEILFADIK